MPYETQPCHLEQSCYIQAGSEAPAVTMKQLSRSARAWFILLLVGQVFCAGFGPPRLAGRDFGLASLWPGQVQQLALLGQRPQEQATAALLIDVGTGRVLYEKNAGRRLAMASTTKMMTALIALERGNLADTVVVQAGDVSVGSVAGLWAGETLTLEDLLYVLLLPSDNAAAVAIARHVGGSEEAFVELMNAKADEWGLEDTHFANPHGLDDPEHYSSAHDLAQIALRGLSQPAFARLVSTRERQVGGRILSNRNELLGSYPGAEGVKTGTTGQAGQCLVSAAGQPDGRALAVVLGSDDRYRDSRALLDYYFANYATVSLGLGPKGVNLLRQADGSLTVLALEGRPAVLLPRWQRPWLQVLRVTQDAGPEGAVGTARFLVGGTLLVEEPLYALAP